MSIDRFWSQPKGRIVVRLACGGVPSRLRHPHPSCLRIAILAMRLPREVAAAMCMIRAVADRNRRRWPLGTNVGVEGGPVHRSRQLHPCHAPCEPRRLAEQRRAESLLSTCKCAQAASRSRNVPQGWASSLVSHVSLSEAPTGRLGPMRDLRRNEHQYGKQIVSKANYKRDGDDKGESLHQPTPASQSRDRRERPLEGVRGSRRTRSHCDEPLWTICLCER